MPGTISSMTKGSMQSEAPDFNDEIREAFKCVGRERAISIDDSSGMTSEHDVVV